MTRHETFASEAEGMAKGGVNLDALIPREDLKAESAPLGGKPTGEVTVSNLRDDIFYSGLRKPDFQRETANWSPQKIADMDRNESPRAKVFGIILVALNSTLLLLTTFAFVASAHQIIVQMWTHLWSR